MLRILSASDIVSAFIWRTAANQLRGVTESTVTVAARGLPNGYVRIWGPNGKVGVPGAPCVIVENYNGAVCFTHEEVARLMQADNRPPEGNVTRHPLGASAGGPGNFGAAKWGLSPQAIADRFVSAAEFVDAVVDAFNRAGVAW